MRFCAFWDCREEVDEGVSFCREHGRRLNRQLIDKCPKCGRYKDTRLKFCPDCTYGRPVAEWKVGSRNLDKVFPYIEPGSLEESVNKNKTPLTDASQPGISKGEPMCPGCGSLNLTYKTAFEYYRCDNCEITFVTPVYNYEAAEAFREKNRNIQSEDRIEPPLVRREPPFIRREPSPPRREQVTPVREQIFPEELHERSNEPVRQQNTAPRYRRKEPNLNLMRRQQVDEATMNPKALKMQKGGKIGWVYLLIVLCIAGLAALVCWIFLNEQISSVLEGLF